MREKSEQSFDAATRLALTFDPVTFFFGRNKESGGAGQLAAPDPVHNMPTIR